MSDIDEFSTSTTASRNDLVLRGNLTGPFHPAQNSAVSTDEPAERVAFVGQAGLAASSKNVAVIGTGYVGLVSGSCLSDLGHRVVCIDADPRKVAELSSARLPIYEPGLEAIVSRATASGHLRFTSDTYAARDTDIVILAVGTPSLDDGRADLSQIFAAASALRLTVDRFVTVVIKSTVPVGTGDEVERILRASNPNASFEVVSNPEFLREGSAVDDFFRPDRIVVGCSTDRARQAMLQLYGNLPNSGTPIFFTTRRSSELVKYAANAFLAMKVAFINEMADLSEATGADIDDLALGIGLDKRIGASFLRAGPGYGGSCFPKDTAALQAMGVAHGAPGLLVQATVNANQQRKLRMARKIASACGGKVAGRRIAVLGLTFKASTDDMRDAPSIDILRHLQKAGATISAFDPEGMSAARLLMPDINYAVSAMDAATGADAVVIMTEWDEFRRIDLARLHAVVAKPVVVDLRNLFSRQVMECYGFTYSSVGRPA